MTRKCYLQSNIKFYLPMGEDNILMYTLKETSSFRELNYDYYT